MIIEIVNFARTGNRIKNYWDINKAGVTLIWKLF